MQRVLVQDFRRELLARADRWNDRRRRSSSLANAPSFAQPWPTFTHNKALLRQVALMARRSLADDGTSCPHRRLSTLAELKTPHPRQPRHDSPRIETPLPATEASSEQIHQPALCGLTGSFGRRPIDQLVRCQGGRMASAFVSGGGCGGQADLLSFLALSALPFFLTSHSHPSCRPSPVASSLPGRPLRTSSGVALQILLTLKLLFLPPAFRHVLPRQDCSQGRPTPSYSRRRTRYPGPL